MGGIELELVDCGEEIEGDEEPVGGVVVVSEEDDEDCPIMGPD